jgi:hypothetical protein
MITTLQLYICNVFCSHSQYVPILNVFPFSMCVIGEIITEGCLAYKEEAAN